MVYYLIIVASSAIFCFSLTAFLKEPFFKLATLSVSQLNIILDNSLEESDKDKQLLYSLTKLLGHFFLCLGILLVIILGTLLMPFLYWYLKSESGVDTSSVYFYASLVVGSISLFAQRKKGDYSYWSKLLHTIVLDNYAIGRYLLAKELKKYEVSIGDRDFLIVTGLARSGTTALTNLIFNKESFHSIKYSNVPFLLSPNLWKKIYKPRRSEQKERAHKDKVLVSEESIESLEEYFFKVHLEDSYIDDHWLNKHQISEDLLLKYYQYQDLFRENKDTIYLAKNNNFLLRYESFRNLNKRFSVVLVFRNPLDHAQSLLNQHKNFIDQQQSDGFVLNYMNWLGHHEFGLNQKHFNLSEGGSHEMMGEKGELSFWLKVWVNYYSYVTKLYGPDKRLFLVDYDDLAQHPNELKKLVGKSIGKELETEYVEPFGLKKTRSESSIEMDNELITEAIDVYKELLSAKLDVTSNISND